MASKIDLSSSRSIAKDFAQQAPAIPSLIVSAEAHEDEPMALWEALPADLRQQLP